MISLAVSTVDQIVPKYPSGRDNSIFLLQNIPFGYVGFVHMLCKYPGDSLVFCSSTIAMN